ncbi:maleylacetate reductase [Nocardia sp. CA-151230]|uniref:maleylacetate reductase n=1 Tax=Nocardia sp. CA-151230 TaxID=3239982 RepID=UPI003D8C6DDF
MNLVFEHVTLGQRIIFGTGAAAENLATEVGRLEKNRVMVIAAPSQAALAREVTRGIPVAVHHSDVAQHVPFANAREARAIAGRNDIDLLVCIGGGSTTGLAKAIALTTGLPIVALPTTYSGSEATNVWGLTESGRKTTGIDNKVLPVSVIYDAALTFSLPVKLSIASGLNGIAHCVDSMWAPRTDPINQTLAVEGIRALSAGLTTIKNDPSDVLGREQALYGAYLSAVAFASAGSGLHHKICHVLGGAYNMPHAETHAVLLPHVLAFNAPAAPEATARIVRAFETSTATAGLASLYARLDAPRALKEYGFREESVPGAAELIMGAVPKSNPRTVTETELRNLLFAAYSGTVPTA